MNSLAEPDLRKVILGLTSRYLGPSPTIIATITELKRFGFLFEQTGAGTYVCCNVRQLLEIRRSDLERLISLLQASDIDYSTELKVNSLGRLLEITITPEGIPF